MSEKRIRFYKPHFKSGEIGGATHALEDSVS